MDEDKIKERMEALQSERLHHEKMCLVIDGALQNCQHWLMVLRGDEAVACSNDETMSLDNEE